MGKKYALTRETLVHNGKTLYRIRALRDFNDVKKGDLGGFVESEDNLSHNGTCWIYDNALVFDYARVFGNAIICGNSAIYGYAEIYGHAQVSGHSNVCDDAEVSDHSEVFDNARICGGSDVFGNARVYDRAIIYDSAIYDNASAYGNIKICYNSKVFGDARIFGNPYIIDKATISGNALITSLDDWASVDSFGSENRTSTFFRCEDGLVRVNCGCFHGTIDEFRKRVIKTHGNNKYAKEYLMIADLMELRFSE